MFVKGFIEICSGIHGIFSHKNVRLNFENFQKAMRYQEFMFFDKQMKELFEILDVNKDGYIDLKDW